MGQIIQPGTLSETDRERDLLLGGGVAICESLANLRVGNVGNSPYVAAYMFKAEKSQRVDKLYLYMELVPPNYSSGGGGTIRMRIYEALPGTTFPNLSSTVYSEGTYSITQSDISSGRAIKSFSLTARHSLTRGNRYCVVFDNLNTSPNVFASVNCAQVRLSYGKSNRWLKNQEWCAHFSSSGLMGNWVNLETTGSGGKGFAPLMNVGYSDGTWQGYSPFESGAVDTRSRLVSGSNIICERFRPKFNRRINGMSFNAACVVPGTIVATIETDTGVSLARVAITDREANYSTEPVGRSNLINGYWYDAQLPHDIFWTANTWYRVRFKADGNSQWRFATHRNGSNRGFPLAYSESYCEINNTSGQLIPFNFHNHSQSNVQFDTNMRLVMHTTPP